jgi:PAS domain S-box-containing protein
VQAQQALVAETNFRRAMENSILTGMRAMDMNGRITYVNAAFCQMTGWSEAELVGSSPTFSLLA